MNTISNVSSNRPIVHSDSPRTLVPNGPLVVAYRKSWGWSRETLARATDDAVKRTALDSNPDARFLQRYKSRLKAGDPLGLATTTLANVEKSRRVYTFTLTIVAVTFRVPLRSLIHPDDPSGLYAGAVSMPRRAAQLADEVIRSANGSERAMTGYEVAAIVRKLLNELFPPRDCVQDEE